MQDYLLALIWSSWPLSPSHTRAAEADRHVQSPPPPLAGHGFWGISPQRPASGVHSPRARR